MRPSRAGKFRDQVRILELKEVRMPGGRYQKDWEEFLKVRAKVIPLSGTERFQAQQIQAELTHRVEMRYHEGIKPQMRVEYKGRTFEITQPPINLEERDRELHLVCAEVISDEG